MFPVDRLILDPVVTDWTVGQWGVPPQASVRWAITWRNFEANTVAVVLGHVLDQAVDAWLARLPRSLALTGALALAVLQALAMLTAWGWITGRVLGRTPPFGRPQPMVARGLD